MISSLANYRRMALGMMCALTVGSAGLQAGDKIQFSLRNQEIKDKDKDREKETVTKVAKPIEAEKFRFFDSGNLNNASPQMIAPPPMLIIPDKKSQEEADRQRNWLLVTPGESQSSLTLEKVYKIKEYEADGREKQPEGVVSRYLQGRQDSSARSRRDAVDAAKMEEETGRTTKLSFESNGMSGTEFGGREGRPELNGGTRREFDVPARPSRFEELAEGRHRERMNDYRQLFEPAGSQPVAARGVFDPINTLADTTRQVANPVTATRSENLDRSRTVNSADPFNANAAAQPPRAPTMESPYERVFGRGPATDLLPQADQNKPKYKPAILPVPKRVM